MSQNVVAQFLCCLALLSSFRVAAVTIASEGGEAQVMTFYSRIDGTDQPYALYLPKSFDRTKRYPLVVSLHGAGQNHRSGLRRVFGVTDWVQGESGDFPPLPEVNFIIAAPLGRGSMGYLGVAEQDVYEMLDDVKRRFTIDENRVYLTGESMGGSGTFQLGLTRPDLWAAIAPVCGGAPAGTEELAPNALNLPVFLRHGDRDETVPIEIARRWRQHFIEAGATLDYQEYAGMGHSIAGVAYRDGAVFNWFRQHRRNPFPERVRFVSTRYQYNKAYWVAFDGLTPGVPAEIDAKFLAKNRIEIRTRDLEGFTLRLAGHPRYDPKTPVTVQLDGATISLLNGDTLSFSRGTKGWAAGRYVPTAGAKRAGLEGPIAAAVAARHLYVYGTNDAPGEAELNLRRSMAQDAADWAGPHGRPQASFPVRTDVEIKDQNLSGMNLVLFGFKETNSIIARLDAKLPLALKSDSPQASKYGLLFLAPVGNEYAIVSSGLPWWTGGEKAERSIFRWQWMSLPYRLLQSFGDFILFKGSVENVVVEGRFDHNWRIRPADAAKLRATGVVVVR